MFAEKQRYVGSVAYRIELSKVPFVQTLVHNYAKKGICVNAGVYFVRFDSEEAFLHCIALWHWSRLCRLRSDYGYGKGRNLWTEAKNIAKKTESEIPWATESFIRGQKVSTIEHSLIA